MKNKILQVFTVILIAILCTSSQLYSQKDYAKTGIYLGGAVSYHSIEGSFDGQSYLYADEDVILLPRMSSGLGWCVILGGRLVPGAVEARYMESTHHFIFLDMSGKADHSIFVLNFKFHFDNHERVQPYIRLGFEFESLTAKNASITMWGIPGDAKFFGGGFSIGFGISFYTTPSMSLFGDAGYRLVGYNGQKSIEGASGQLYEYEGEDRMSGDGLFLNVGITITLVQL